MIVGCQCRLRTRGRLASLTRICPRAKTIIFKMSLEYLRDKETGTDWFWNTNVFGCWGMSTAKTNKNARSLLWWGSCLQHWKTEAKQMKVPRTIVKCVSVITGKCVCQEAWSRFHKTSAKKGSVACRCIVLSVYKELNTMKKEHNSVNRWCFTFPCSVNGTAHLPCKAASHSSQLCCSFAPAKHNSA